MKHIIINIGRQFGSGGKEVAMEIGNRLGIHVYDNELLIKAAEQSGFSRELFNRNDEKRTLFGIPLSPGNFIGAGNCMDGGMLFKMQSKAIQDIAENESAVIVGRCADYVLRERKDILNVFISAPMSVRIRRICKRLDVSPEKAAEIIQKKDRKREAYYNYFTFGNWGAASNYDLCIDSSILGTAGTAGYIIDFARREGLTEDLA